MSDMEILDELNRCRDVIRRMQEEIISLRYAAVSFGELADRLNEELQNIKARDDHHEPGVGTHER
jgi:hypothetical protein